MMHIPQAGLSALMIAINRKKPKVVDALLESADLDVNFKQRVAMSHKLLWK